LDASNQGRKGEPLKSKGGKPFSAALPVFWANLIAPIRTLLPIARRRFLGSESIYLLLDKPFLEDPGKDEKHSGSPYFF